MSQNQLEPNFSALILSLGASAAIGLGIEANPSTGKFEKNKDMAKFNIDLLLLLKEKTKGNLAAAESDLLEKLILDLQMKFVQNH